MKKNNLWNRLFHAKEVEANKHLICILQEELNNLEDYYCAVDKAQDLLECIDVHKRIWIEGVQPAILAPSEWGVFRTQSIPTMTNHQVWLGGIYGLNTYAVAYWEQYRDEPYGPNGFGIDEKTSLYGMILTQYKRILRQGIHAYKDESINKIAELKKAGY